MKKNYLTFISLIEKNLLASKGSKNSALKFFRSDSVSIEIYYKILISYYIEEPTHYDELCKKMHNGSRMTIKKIIDNATANGFLIKNTNVKDHRKVDIIPSDQMIKEFEDHALELKEALEFL